MIPRPPHCPLRMSRTSTFVRSSHQRRQSLPRLLRLLHFQVLDHTRCSYLPLLRHRRVQTALVPHVTTNRPHTQSVFVGTRSFPHDRPPPATTRPPSPPPAAQQNSTNQPSRQPVVAIVFEVIAGVAGIFILISISRCIYSWKRTPSRDRIAGLLSRHQLDREMAELEREQMERRRRQWRRNSVQGPPPPPYQRAPSYETLPIHGEDHV